MRTVTLFCLVICMAVCMQGFSQQAEATIQPVSKGYAPVNGQQVYYEVYGDGPPVVLLHGAFMTIGLNWAPMLPALAKNHKVIALEMQGHGHTPQGTRKAIVLDTMADDVAKTLAYLNIPKADIIGYSMGGVIAWKLVMDYPSLVNKAVIISSTYKSEGWQKEGRAALSMMKPEFFTNTPLQQGYDLVAPNKANWLPFVKQMIVLNTQTYNLGDDRVATVKSPMLLVSGDNDGIDKSWLFDTYRKLGGGVFADMGAMPKSRLAILPGQGHVGVMMQTAELLQIIGDFLK